MADIAAAAPRIKPEHRIALFYFTMMMPTGVAAVYAGIWFASNGMSTQQIGIVNAVPVLVMLTINLTIGRVADRASDWRLVIVGGATIQGLATLGLFFVNEFWGILAVWTLAFVPNTAISPVADAATMRLTKRNGTSFGPIRASSTIGYVLAVGSTGLLIGNFGGHIFVPLYVGLSMLKALTAQALPNFRAPAHLNLPKPPAGRRLKEVMKPWFVVPLIGYAMAFSTHIILNAFAPLLWKAQGISETAIGPLIVLGAVAEASIMISWKWLGNIFDPRTTMLLSALVAVFRWSMMGLSPPVYLLVFLQLLHAFTFAVGYLSCVHFIAQNTGEDIAAEAQSFYVVVQQSISVVSLLVFGTLIGPFGAHAYFVAATMALVGAGLIFAASRRR